MFLLTTEAKCFFCLVSPNRAVFIQTLNFFFALHLMTSLVAADSACRSVRYRLHDWLNSRCCFSTLHPSEPRLTLLLLLSVHHLSLPLILLFNLNPPPPPHPSFFVDVLCVLPPHHHFSIVTAHCITQLVEVRPKAFHHTVRTVKHKFCITNTETRCWWRVMLIKKWLITH